VILSESPEANRFIAKVDREAQRLSVQLLFSLKNDVMALDTREATDGYFTPPEDDSPGFLVVPIGKQEQEWLHTLAHEYVHMCQWFRDDDVWVKWRSYNCDSNYYRLEEATEHEACEIIMKYKLPCGDAPKRAASYLRRLKRGGGSKPLTVE